MTISSRYSLKTISSRYYQQIMSGNTYGNTSGIVFAPYIMVQNEPTVAWREWERQKLKEIRIEKLQKIKNITI